MTLADILVQFVTIFLGAFLAFWLENVRERQQLKRWVKTYLNRQYKSLKASVNNYDIQNKVYAERVELLAELLEPDLKPIQGQWDALLSSSYGHFDSTSFLTQGETLQVLPDDLVGAITQQNETTRVLTLIEQITFQFHSEHVLAFALREPSPLDKGEKAVLRYYKIVTEQALELRQTAKQADETLLGVLESHGYHC